MIQDNKLKGQSLSSDRKKLIKTVAIRFILGVIVVGLVFFLPAGTFKYWHAWGYCGVLFVPMFFVFLYLLKNNPALLERRMRTKEKVKPQRLLARISILVYVCVFVLPGFDFRFGWSSVPVVVVIIADIIVFLGYLLFFLVLRENPYASRIIEVEEDQKVVTTGLYAFVRHPMYLAALMIFLLSPIALGSFWAAIAATPLPVLFVFRIRDEEKLLINKLAGYHEYTQKVRYRLIPMIW